MTKRYAFFQHRPCEFFPCHKGVAEEEFNCLFCFCPLYALGRDCGGDFVIDEKTGIKDCSNCVFPHIRDNYDSVMEKCRLLTELVREE